MATWTSGLQLRVLEGPGSGRAIPLEGKRAKIGRQIKPGAEPPRDSIWIDDATISRIHCELKWNGSAYVIHHRSGTNLTRVNGQSIDKYVLSVGDRIGLGTGLFELQPVTFKVSGRPRPRSEGDTTLRCPRDRTGLTFGSFREVPFDSCSYCNGAWLAQGKLSRIHGLPDDLQWAVPVEAAEPAQCPQCDVFMERLYLSSSGGIEVCRCQKCLGVWLDTDGMKGVLKAVRRSQATLPAVVPPKMSDGEPPEVTAPPLPPPVPKVTLPPPVTEAVASGKAVLLERLRKTRGAVLDQAPAEPKKEEPPVSLDISEELAAKVSISAVVDSMLNEAIARRASDIHVEGVRDELRVRYRVDGQLLVAHIWPKIMQAPLITRLQVMAQLNISNPWLPQDGHFVAEIQGREFDFRLATVPSERGPACVIRILDPNKAVARLDQLGFHPEDLQLIRRALDLQQGFILTTGPSGSGKTTTLYSMLIKLCSRPTKTVTIEDPVEYRLDQVVQVPVNHKVGMDFATGLRSVLRLDPDSILVGEIRDRETAEIAVQASLTGHLMLSTLHTRGTVESILRFMEMGIEPFLIKETVNCVIAQRLVRMLCSHCRQHYTPQESDLIGFGIQPSDVKDNQFYRPLGCDECNHTGYHGRTAIMEVMVSSEAVRDAITPGATVKDIRAVAIQGGMRPLHLNAFDKVAQGLTSFDEIRHVCSSQMGS